MNRLAFMSGVMRENFFCPMRRSLASGFFLSLALLFLAGCQKPEEQAVQRLERMDYTVDAPGLQRAIESGDLRAVELFAQAGTDLDQPGVDESTPLMKAAELGQVEIIEALIEYGADVNRPGRDGETPLMTAAFYNRPAAVELLLEAGAETMVFDDGGWTALTKAVYHGHEGPSALLIGPTPEQETRALMLASLLGHTAIVESFLDQDVDPNSRFEDNKTALMYAAMNGHRDVLVLLLERGADPLLTNDAGETAETMALNNGKLELVMLLEQHTQRLAETPAVEEEEVAVVDEEMPVATEPGEVSETVIDETEFEVVRQPSESYEPALPEAEGEVVEETETVVDIGEWESAEPSPDYLQPELPRADGPDALASPVASGLVMVEYDSPALPFVLSSTGPGYAVVEFQSGPITTERLTPGNRVSGHPFELVSARHVQDADKDGAIYEASQATFLYTETGERFTVTRGEITPSPDTSALLRVPGREQPVRVRRGQDFIVEGPPETRYTVVEIRPSQVIAEEAGTGRTVTIQMNP